MVKFAKQSEDISLGHLKADNKTTFFVYGHTVHNMIMTKSVAILV